MGDPETKERDALRRIRNLAMPLVQYSDEQAHDVLFVIQKIAGETLGITDMPIGCSGD